MDSRLFPVLLATPVLLLLALGIVAFVLRYQRRLLRQQEQMREMGEMAQQQALEAALLAQEEERRRIAGDLHDGVGTTLAIVKLHLSTLAQPELTQEASLLLDQAIGEVRRISRNLLPAALQKFGLPFALDALARTMPADGPTHITLEQHGTPRRLDSHYELIVYRVVQELLGNGLRHAHAAHIDIQVEFGVDTLSLYYADDGVGFDPTATDQPPLPGNRTGLGLTNLRSRVAVLRGGLRHESAPGQGSRVWISLPIPYLSKNQPATPSYA
ncbi:sensor histidine kinase [Hymenobacter mucosus]|uniref:Oxygen sensor histidine kinase NreB n=1 Tax=Hymenobacter mucosus TaxID=1411120 RepID=A0A238YMP3_9BACT|nr:sensor histidine kinase [Hymenobacter mucosus]SNR71709.1 Histidine kinase-, DNA gyrase B-, and HSP90-like ATPase [Hymenobacter mucosus]